MAFNDTSAIQDWRQLVEISLTGKTVRYSRDPVTLTDGTFYDDRLIGISSMALTAGQLLDPRFTMPSLTMTLDNADQAITDLLDEYAWANRSVTVKVGQGTNPSDYTTVFIGSVVFPAGISFNDLGVSIDVDDDRMKDQKVLPTGNFFTAIYSNLEDKSKNLPVPIIYGDWRTSAGNGEKVPCYCINTSTKTFKIASHAIKEIQAVYKNGSAITPASTDLTNAEFTLGSDSYDPVSDTITANIQGATHNGSSSGTLLETLPDIVNDILQTHLSVASGNIDSTAFNAWENNISEVKARRHISAEISSNTLITQALIEGFADMIIDGGKYTPKFRITGLSSLDQYRNYDLINNPDGTKQFSVSMDPERVTLNQVVSSYNRDPTNNNEFSEKYVADDTASQALLETTRRRRLNFEWLYRDDDATKRAQRELMAFSTELELLTVGVGPRALTKRPLDQFRVIHNKYVEVNDFGTPFQIRDITVDFGKMSAVIRAWNILTILTGRYTTSTAPNWTSSNNQQRLDHGFYTDANGFSDPSGSPSATSKRSRWF